MGTNNIGNYSIDDAGVSEKRELFKKKFFERIQKLGADPLWVVSILPRNYEGKQVRGVNQNIEVINRLVQNGLDSLGDAYRFIDVFSSFLSENYRTNMGLFKDGLHPNEEGYEVLTSKVQARL